MRKFKDISSSLKLRIQNSIFIVYVCIRSVVSLKLNARYAKKHHIKLNETTLCNYLYGLKTTVYVSIPYTAMYFHL